MAEKTLAEEINSAIAEVTEGSPDETDEVVEGGAAAADDGVSPAADTDDDGTGGEASDDGAQDDSEGAEGAEPPAQTAAELAAEADKLGISKRRADGQFKSKDELAAEIAAAKTGDGKGDKPADRKDTPKKSDPVNDPIDKTLKPATQERIRTLIDRTKEAEGRAEKAAQDFNYLVQGVQATGASPEQYHETLSWLSLFNSADPAQQRQALELLEVTADRLATMLGVDRQVSDPLKQHPDLQAAIQGGKITREYAQEMARNRNQGQLRTQLTTAATEEQNRAAAAAKEVSDARAGLNELEAQLSASDPQYEAKKAAILPTLKVLFPSIRPAMWKDAFTKAYREVQIQAPARQQVRRVPAQQPLRAGRNPAGAGAGGSGNLAAAPEGPKSAMDAVNQALARMGR